MDAITAIATDHGLDVLNSALKNTATQYQLIGAEAHDATDDQLAVFYSAEIETSYYDDNGVLTFVIELPVAEDFNRYLYAVQVTDTSDQVVISAPTPKIALATGVGGMLTLKAAVTGEAGEVIFKASDYITESEMTDTWLPPIWAGINSKLTKPQADSFYEIKGSLLETRVLAANSRLAAALSGTTLNIEDDQEIYFPNVGIINTTTIPDFTDVDASAFYHFRWSLANGFELKNLADNTYNPNNYTHRHPSFFENKIDDVCLGGILQGQWCGRILTPNRKHHIKPTGTTGAMVLPFGYGDRRFQMLIGIYASTGYFAFANAVGTYLQNTASGSANSNSVYQSISAYNQSYGGGLLTTNNSSNESCLTSVDGLVFENGNLVPDIQLKTQQFEDGGAGNYSNSRDFLFGLGRIGFTVAQQQTGLVLNYTNLHTNSADVVFEVI